MVQYLEQLDHRTDLAYARCPTASNTPHRAHCMTTGVVQLRCTLPWSPCVPHRLEALHQQLMNQLDALEQEAHAGDAQDQAFLAEVIACQKAQHPPICCCLCLLCVFVFLTRPHVTSAILSFCTYFPARWQLSSKILNRMSLYCSLCALCLTPWLMSGPKLLQVSKLAFTLLCSHCTACDEQSTASCYCSPSTRDLFSAEAEELKQCKAGLNQEQSVLEQEVWP